ncbi:WW domain-containing oxidoreductase [Colletotrichum orbiculare MAFF 240422]|uniref:WW domain-containing oxidoreductase n=1 Tax=Colletotrichum orbiculare (strain 104-T / ATCC 96160 / CBS 514.97 / LARS 414 / MAFF 240422) TaxID=1213857 RepID=N4VR13_COLOR|nr:WW domain-containing oxidoreductase [Colletotrichum orbiculare MAFF 240422]
MSRYAAAHVNPQGQGDARPTAMQIVHDEDLVGKLAGRAIFITGANQGIGLETTRALHATGATIYLGVRDLKRGQQAIDDVNRSNPDSPGELHLVEMSLDSLASVRKGAESFLARSKQLNILVLNAGVMCAAKEKTTDGFEKTFGTNHVGHFLLFQLLKDALLAATTPTFNSRVVVVSSQMHRASEIRFDDLHFDKSDYHEYVAYGQSKIANVYLTNEIERRYGARGLHALSLHPGAVVTNMNREKLSAAEADLRERIGSERYEALYRSMKSQPQGAATTVYAAIGREWEGRGGRYLSELVEKGPADPDTDPMSSDTGYAAWAYDEEKASRLWRVSNKMVGLAEDA